MKMPIDDDDYTGFRCVDCNAPIGDDETCDGCGDRMCVDCREHPDHIDADEVGNDLVADPYGARGVSTRDF